MTSVPLEPLVFLPGMMCDARLFTPQLAAFQAERNVMVMDITSEHSMASLARKVLDNAPERFALAGFQGRWQHLAAIGDLALKGR